MNRVKILRILKTTLSILLVLITTMQLVVAQEERSVSGTVSDENGDALIGATIVVEGTSQGVVTDLDGLYSVNVLSNSDILVISYIGYETQKITVGVNSIIDVTLSTQNVALSEVVVTGYSLQSTATVTSSIERIDGEKIENLPAGGVSVNALAGRVPGVSIFQNSGEPGAVPNIQIRGGTTPGFSGDNPLYIVDGFVQDDPSDIDMNDVAEFTILKDAASTAIYGAQAANGVILIKTKSGKKGKTEVTFKYNYGYESVERAKQDWLTPEEEIYYGRLGFLRYEGTTGYSRLNRSGWWASPQPIDAVNNASILYWYDDVIAANGGSLPSGYVTTNDPLTGKLLAWEPTDWEAKTLTPGNANTFYLNLAGGTEKSKYSISLSSLNDDAVGVFNKYNRYYLNSKVDFKLSEKLTSGISFRYTYTNEDDGGGGNWYQRSGRQPTTIRFYNDDGSPAPNNANGGKPNPEFYEQNRLDETIFTDVNVSAFINWNIIEGLNFKPSIGLRHRGTNILDFQSSNILSSSRPQNGFIFNGLNTQIDGLLTYDKSIGSHNFGLLAGTSFRNGYSYQVGAFAEGGSTDLIPVIIGSTPRENSDATTSHSQTAIQSWFGQLTYDYNTKYLLNATLRRDGNYKFTTNNQWGLFYGISAGWNIHNESIWSDMGLSNLLNRMKFTVAYGEAGKTSGMSINDTNGAYGTNIYGGQGGIVQTTLENADLVWETTREINTKIQTEFIGKSRINFSAEYYDKTSLDRLFLEPLPSFTGFTGIRTNVGTFQSTGLEFVAGATIVANSQVSWNISGFADILLSQKTIKLPETSADKNRISGFLVADPGNPSTLR